MELYGIWDVTTEGDEEGRTVRHLGFYKGFIDQIALHLANKVMYSLSFEKLKIHGAISPEPTGKSVVVKVPGGYTKTVQECVAIVNAAIEDAKMNFADYVDRKNDVKVSSSTWGGVKIEVME